MKIEIRQLKTIDGKEVAQITTTDERWYQDGDKFRPSSSWICSYYPKGKYFEEWLKKNGTEAEELKNLAGERGSKIHQAIDLLIKGEELKIDKLFDNFDKGTKEELTADEWEAVSSFYDWHIKTKPKYISNEYTVINEKDNYGGTIDIKCEIDGKLYIIDIKSSQSIYPSHEIQLASYKHADIDCEKLKLAILQVGYRLNKSKYKFTEIEDKYKLFLSVKEIWAEENENKQPKQRDLPTKLKL